MTALAENKLLKEKEGKLIAMPVVASDIIYQGAMVKVNAAGYLAPCAGEAGSQFAGIAYEKVDNSAGSAGDKTCRVICDQSHFYLSGSGFTQADVGSVVYADDDQVVTLTEGTTSKQVVGNIVEFVSATEVVVKIKPYSGIGASA